MGASDGAVEAGVVGAGIGAAGVAIVEPVVAGIVTEARGSPRGASGSAGFGLEASGFAGSGRAASGF